MYPAHRQRGSYGKPGKLLRRLGIGGSSADFQLPDCDVARASVASPCLISSSLIGPCARLAALRKSSSGWWSVTSELLCRLLLQRGRARIQGVADAPHRVWAVDFQSDATTDGRPIKIVSIIDEHTRECLGGLVQRSITGESLIAELDCLAAGRGTYPAVLRCDNGPELACVAMADWANSRVGLHFIPPGQPGATATSNRSTPGSATNA